MYMYTMLYNVCRGEDFYPTANSLGYGGVGEVSEAGLDRMVTDLHKQ